MRISKSVKEKVRELEQLRKSYRRILLGLLRSSDRIARRAVEHALDEYASDEPYESFDDTLNRIGSIEDMIWEYEEPED